MRSSSANAEVDKTAAVAAVKLVVSVLSMVIFVENIVVPLHFMLTVKIVPLACAVTRDAFTELNVKAAGALVKVISFGGAVD